jgi:hypothetical protein
MANLKLSSPWMIWYKKLNEFFKYDKDVTILFDQENYLIKMFVADGEKWNALRKLLPENVQMGNVDLKIEVVPPNHLDGANNEIGNVYEAAFKNNPVLSYVKKVDNVGIFPLGITYVVFENKVVQFFSDDISDINGFTSTLYQDIAKDIFGQPDNVFYCTNIPGIDK